MKLLMVLMSCLLFHFPTDAAAQSIPPVATCNADQTPVWIILKESFRYNPTLDDGTHRFLLLVGCSVITSDTSCTPDSSACENITSQITGMVYLGRELDADYPKTSPNPIAGTVSTLPFSGTEQSSKDPAHGEIVQIQSCDGQISANGDFYSNRDLSYTVDGVVVQATLPSSL